MPLIRFYSFSLLHLFGNTPTDMIEVNNFGVANQYITIASIDLVGDAAWIIMVWPLTDPGRKDKYLP